MTDYTQKNGKNPKAPLQRAQVRNEKIRTMFESGSYSQAALARIFHISRQRIGQILEERTLEEVQV